MIFSRVCECLPLCAPVPKAVDHAPDVKYVESREGDLRLNPGLERTREAWAGLFNTYGINTVPKHVPV